MFFDHKIPVKSESYSETMPGKLSLTPTCTRVFQNTHIVRERTGKTNERTTVVDTNSLTSRGLLTQKKTIPGTKKVFGHLVVRN